MRIVAVPGGPLRQFRALVLTIPFDIAFAIVVKPSGFYRPGAVDVQDSIRRSIDAADSFSAFRDTVDVYRSSSDSSDTYKPSEDSADSFRRTNDEQIS